MADTEDARRLSRVVNHPIRAKIIELLGEKGPLAWKELSEALGVKTGALYHHLDILEGLVERDPSKKYSLTKSGRIIFERTSVSKDFQSIQGAAKEIMRQGALRRRLVSFFVPRAPLETLTSSRPRSMAVFAVLAAAMGAWLVLAGVAPALYFLRAGPGPYQSLGVFALSLASLLLVCTLGAKIMSGPVPDLPSLAAGCVFSYLPVFFYSVLVQLPEAGGALTSSSSLYTAGQVVFQAWSGAVLGAALSAASGIRIEKTLPIGLIAVYATMFLMLLNT
ncbi:MAG TPA: ArsR family transcriptional regulator [Nitrososphaerales archaeon]|nr:ArsR family transcriptional regulator [Nitrososphaerales archaeon]